MTFALRSPAFGEGGTIPRRFTCDGADVSPPLSWDDPPAGTQSFALVVDDPDAPVGTWVHWVVYGIPAHARGLPEGVPTGERLPTGGVHGKNSWGRLGYGGPCPPGGTHRYFFRLYALSTPPDLEPGATREELLRAMEGRIVGEAALVGRYGR